MAEAKKSAPKTPRKRDLLRDFKSAQARQHRTRTPQKICSLCNESKKITEFYKVNTPLSSDGLSLFCKECTIKQCIDKDGILDLERFKVILRQMDRPFIQTVLDAAVSEYENRWIPLGGGEVNQTPIVTMYFKNISSLPQYAKLNYAQGEIYNKIKAAGTDVKAAEVPVFDDNGVPKSRSKSKKNIRDNERIFLGDVDESDDDFEVTKEIVEQFGSGFTKAEYRAMQKKYQFLLESYPEVSTLHKESLTLYCKYRVKEEFAIMEGNADAAEKWASLASKQADKAKINPSQLTQSDLQNGVTSISELFMQLERNEDILRVLPKFKFAPNDSVDFLIWEYINYGRRLKGEPDVDYEDIWAFYDERKKAYLEQTGDPYGLFDEDPTEKNRQKIKKFVTIPKEYEDGTEE